MGGSCCSPRRDGDLNVPASVAGSRVVADASGNPGLEFVSLPGGRFLMGTEDADGFPEDREGPIRSIAVAPFAITRTAVSNRQFADFVAATSYVTDAERFDWSFVFARFVPASVRRESPRPEAAPWWCAVRGASWRAPEGPGSVVDGRQDHPAVHVSWHDAVAFADWAGGRLPTEAEWEYAARGGLEQARYAWGDELDPDGHYMCNIWRGRFPTHPTSEDGYVGTAPVDAFLPNGYGLFNVSGNVWEWCAERWQPGSEERVMRGGSYLCHSSYCNRYRVAARSHTNAQSGSGNNGFRVARSVQ